MKRIFLPASQNLQVSVLTHRQLVIKSVARHSEGVFVCFSYTFQINGTELRLNMKLAAPPLLAGRKGLLAGFHVRLTVLLNVLQMCECVMYTVLFTIMEKGFS